MNGENSSFLESINEFNSNGNDGKKATPILKIKTKGIDPIRLIVILLCLCVFSYSAFSLFQIYRSNLDSDVLYNDIYNDFASLLKGNILTSKATLPGRSTILSSSAFNPSKGGTFNTIQSNTTSLKFQQSLSKLEALKSQNPDIVGYISVSGTGINYPIVQCDDNDYYIDHGFDKTYMKSGSIFYDYRSSSTPDKNKNLIVYGHNMLNGSMFHQLESYIEKEDIFQNGTITIYSFDGIYTYDVFAVYYADSYSNYLDITFFNDNTFLNWCDQRKKLSLFKKDITFTPESKIISLSTCINATSSGRIAVHGVLTNVER